ncbi:MFS transporter [Paenibacillus sp. B01]|nr:MFS transporter [Paenibacillus sp. B01]
MAAWRAPAGRAILFSDGMNPREEEARDHACRIKTALTRKACLPYDDFIKKNIYKVKAWIKQSVQPKRSRSPMNQPRQFRWLWAGQSISNLGDALYLLAIVTIVYKLTGSALFSSLVPLARVAGQLACGAAAPIVMDRWPLTRLIKLSQLLQVLLFLMLLLAVRGLTEDGIGYVLVLIGLLSFTDGITTPVRNALVPRYAGKKQLLRANGLMSTTDQIVMMAGWAAGGIIVAWLGASPVLNATLGIYAAALFMTLRLREPEGAGTGEGAKADGGVAAASGTKADVDGAVASGAKAEAGVAAASGMKADVDGAAASGTKADAGVRKEADARSDAGAEWSESAQAQRRGGSGTKPENGAWASIQEGWRNIWRNPVLRLIFFIETIEGTVSATWIGALLLVYATEQLGSGTQWYGFINAGYFAGCIAGGLLVVAFTRRLSRQPALSIAAGAGLMGLFTLAFAWTTAPLLALALVVLMGPPQQLREVTRRTVFQKVCPPEQLPKVMSAENTLVYSLFGLSVVLLSWMADRWGVGAVYAMAGLFYLTTAILTALFRHRIDAAAREADAAEAAAEAQAAAG